MFYYINGTISHIDADFAAVDCGGVGYKVYTSVAALLNKTALGEKAKFYTYVHIKEDAMDIYGFITEEELNLFKLLISVSGVGPKAGLSIMSAFAPNELVKAIVTSDSKAITKAQGIGSKIASRIGLELKDKLGSTMLSFPEAENAPDTSALNEAVSALVSLGYSQQDAKNAAIKAGADLPLEDIIKNALAYLLKN